MSISTPLKLKAGATFLAPVFIFLTACGGGSATSPDTPAAASPPVNYAPDSSAALISSQPLASTAASDIATSSTATDSTQLLATITSTSDSYTFCAKEWAICSFSGTKVIRYGANGSYFTKTATTSIPCNNTSFGDPLPGVAKTCDYLSASTTTTGTRDPLKQPFASTSIWNMPIGSGASYVAANLSGNPGNNIWAKMPGIDDEHIVLKPSAPMTNINFSSVAWSGGNRCSATGGLLVSVPMPSNYLVPNNAENSGAAFLMPDARTLVQTQPLARCVAGGPATSLVKFAPVDLYGPGITGAHGGSGLSAIGGSIRVGELRPGSTGPRHALKINIWANLALYKCTTKADCFRWPAVTADSHSVGYYGTISNINNYNTAMKMGALLAIPASTPLSTLNLETEPAKQLAWTLQNYGAYIVDNSGTPGFYFSAENGPDGSMRTQFKSDWGFELEQKVQGGTAWVRDIQKLAQALYVVNNNSPTSIGGGGTPRQPLAPAIAP